jgi:Lrp/AsnC family transcriptional regulator, leucine-responsive regulatory protein
MSANLKFDNTDRKILEILQQDAKITNAQLSKEIGLSPAPTLERVKKLENAGVILSYHAYLDKPEIGLGVTTFIQVTLKGHRKEFVTLFVDRINQIPEIIECHHITGKGDFILKAVAADISSYQRWMIDVISEIPEIHAMETTVILHTFKDSKVMPIPLASERT